MFRQFNEDLTYLPKRKFNAKYTIPFLLIFLCCVLIGQILSMVVPLSRLNRAQGIIVNIETKIVSWHHSKGSFHEIPDYALVISLSNGRDYKIQDSKTMVKLNSTLKSGDNVIIYYPTKVLKILTAGFARDVSQVERGSTVLYSWKEQQTEEWFIVGIVVLFMALLYWLKRYLNDYMETRTL